MCCQRVKSLLENLLEYLGTHYLWQTLKTALTILMYRLSRLLSSSSSSLFFFLVNPIERLDWEDDGKTCRLKES